MGNRLPPVTLAIALVCLVSSWDADASPSPNPSCQIPGSDVQQFGSLNNIAPAVAAELLKRVRESTQTETSIAARDAEWQSTDFIAKPLPTRRFIRGGRKGNRWFVWYEAGGRGHSFHVAVFELEPGESNPLVVAHLRALDPDELCPITNRLLFVNPAGGSVTSDYDYW